MLKTRYMMSLWTKLKVRGNQELTQLLRKELGVTPDDPADTGIDETVLVAGDVDRDNLG